MQTARDRLVDTARRLFLARGVPSVGINEVIATAGVARMTLYNHFRSKDDLVAASFEAESARRHAALQAALDAAGSPAEKALALFDVAERLAEAEGFRGCAFVNLAVETAAPDSRLHELALRHKRQIRDGLRDLLCAEGRSDADRLAQQILVLWDGAIVGAYLHRSAAPIAAAREAVATLLARPGLRE
jgi:AcrR family transcriptional regulator